MTALRDVLDSFRVTSQSEREKGNYFENLSKLYFQNEPKYKDLYENVWLWEEWRKYWIAYLLSIKMIISVARVLHSQDGLVSIPSG